jgi:hypothetical protein
MEAKCDNLLSGTVHYISLNVTLAAKAVQQSLLNPNAFQQLYDQLLHEDMNHSLCKLQ